MSTEAEIRNALDAALTEGRAAVEAAGDLASLEEARVRTLGRKAPLSRARSSLGSLDEDERRSVGRHANEVQSELENAVEAKRREFEAAELQARWERERVDVSLPGADAPVGSLHPITRTAWEIVDIFIGLGYRLAEGPEAELSTYNFDALNTPPWHPARSSLDTYYIEGSDEAVCLRTQTSPVQIRAMEGAGKPPVYVVAPGRTYRRDVLDATHLNMFTQIEGLAVDEGITMGDLKGTLEYVAREIFGRELQVQLRPHHFPFTEPSAEMDVQCFVCKGSDPRCRLCKGEGWIEILGCGVVHPFLLEWVGFDPQRYSGFAFGMGVERIAMLAHGINDIRYFLDNDLRFLANFKGLV